MGRAPQRWFLSTAVLAAGALAGCTRLTTSFLDPHGPVAATQRDLFFAVIGWMAIVIVPVLLLVPLLAWRYRRGNRAAAYRPEWTFSWPLETAIWGVPVAIVAVLSCLIVADEVPLDPYKAIESNAPPLEIEVVGLDWKWLFIYPGQKIATVGELALPAHRPVHLRLTSDSVMQSFFIPALGSQIYAMAGMVTQLNLRADKAGALRGLNTQYNGDGFHRQIFAVNVMPDEDFARWVDGVSARGRALDDTSYRVLARKGTLADARQRLATAQMPAAALYFAPAPATLFDAIVARYRPPPGSAQGGRQAALP